MAVWTDGATYLMHHGIKGQKWGVRRFQNEDGSLTSAGKERYNRALERSKKYGEKADRQIEMHGGKAGAKLINDIKTTIGAVPFSALAAAAPILGNAVAKATFMTLPYSLPYQALSTAAGLATGAATGGLALAGLAYVAYNGARMAAAIKDSTKAQDVVVSSIKNK